MTRISGVEYTEITPVQDVKRSPGLDCSAMMAVPDHRSGWNYVNTLLSTIHNPNGYILVDFVEKIWCWNKLSPNEQKGVFFEDTPYYVNPEEIRMIHGIEYVVLHHKNEDIAVFWSGDAWEKSALSVDVVRKADQYGVFKTPWVGIIHNPTNMPKWFDYENSPQALVQNENFNKSLAFCKGIIVFSEYLKQELLKMGGWPCTIHVLYHPTEPCVLKWQNKLTCNLLRRTCATRLVQIGYWLRKMTSIWEVNVPRRWKKYWVNRAQYGFKCLEKEIVNDQKLLSILQNESKVEVKQLTNEEYDEFLTQSVAFLDLYDSSCNNVIIECITRHVPIIVKRIPATIEYLGKDYCLFFDNLDDVYALLDNPELIQKAHEQLVALEESGRYYGEYFISEIQKLPFMTESVKLNANIDTTPVLSLGVDCLPRAMSTKFHFKKTKEQGGLTCPFDLAWHDYETVCRLLKNDFHDYLNPLRLYVNQNGHISHRDYSIVFNHESDDADKLMKFIKNDYEAFKERYEQRIQNWKHILHQSSRVVFLLHYKQYPTELVSIIKEKYPHLEFTILTINCPYFHETYLQQPTNVENDTESFLFYTIKKPMDDYLWYVHNDKDWESIIEQVYEKHLNKYSLN